MRNKIKELVDNAIGKDEECAYDKTRLLYRVWKSQGVKLPTWREFERLNVAKPAAVEREFYRL